MNSKTRWGLEIAAVAAALLVGGVIVSLLAGPGTSNLAYAETGLGVAAAQAATPTPANLDPHHDATAAVTPTPTVMTGVTTQTTPSASSVMGSRSPITGTMPSGMMSGDMLAMMQSMRDQMAQMMTMMPSGAIPSDMMSGARKMDEGALPGRLSPNLAGIKPLTVTQVEIAVSDFLAGLGNSDLGVTKVLVFDNHTYARVAEKSTGIGAFEALVDPETLAVFPEFGPNMMWNTKYGHMGGMMSGNWLRQPTASPSTLPTGEQDAVNTAQAYLNANLPGAQTSDHPTQFYGYYTIDILRDGKPIGMLSVNGYTKQVFVHVWHGNFIEESGE
jgi:hypothetical protein